MARPLVITPLVEQAKGVDMTNNERQTRLREKRLSMGYKPVTVWLPVGSIPEFLLLAEQCRNAPESRPVSVSLQDAKTGRMQGVRLR